MKKNWYSVLSFIFICTFVLCTGCSTPIDSTLPTGFVSATPAQDAGTETPAETALPEETLNSLATAEPDPQESESAETPEPIATQREEFDSIFPTPTPAPLVPLTFSSETLDVSFEIKQSGWAAEYDEVTNALLLVYNSSPENAATLAVAPMNGSEEESIAFYKDIMLQALGSGVGTTSEQTVAAGKYSGKRIDFVYSLDGESTNSALILWCAAEKVYMFSAGWQASEDAAVQAGISELLSSFKTVSMG